MVNMNFVCFMILGTISALLGWIFFVDHSWSVTAAPQESVTNFYDWFGSLQDWQRFYEGPAVDIMLKNCEIEEDSTIFEFGFGTGYLAKYLIDKYSKSKYIGVDVSKTMYNLTSDRLSDVNKDRSQLYLAKDSLAVLQALPNQSIDRFISTYVFDLLPKHTMKEIIDTLQVKLNKNGKICLTSLTDKVDDNQIFAKIILNGWNTLARFCNVCVGGCRPIDLNWPFNVQQTLFSITFQHVHIQFGIPSQILIAQKLEKKSKPKREKKK